MHTRTPRTAVSAALLTMLAMLSALLPAASVQADTQPRAQTVQQSVTKYQNQARAATNNKRAAHDRKKLKRGKCVQRFAGKQARWMAEHNSMEHQAMGPILKRCNLSMVAENIAFGWSTGRKVVGAWMHSRLHRKNMLRRGYRLLGMAVRYDDDGTPWASQVFGRR